MSLIKECPFCGNTANLEFNEDKVFVKCGVCSARANGITLDAFDKDDELYSRQKLASDVMCAIREWNRRTGEK